MEIAHWRGQHRILALLECSKCHERVEHFTGREDAQNSGCPQDIADTAFLHYAGTRILRAHGARGPPTTGAHGIVAGCSFAKDFLKSFLLPAPRSAIKANSRDYVDDTTLLGTGHTHTHTHTPTAAATQLLEDRDRVKEHLRAQNMQLDDSKERVLGPTAAVRKAWEDATGSQAVDVVRDLGTFHYGYGATHPELARKLEDYRTTASRMGILPIPRERKVQIAAAILYGRTLYGAETQPLTLSRFHTMRRHMATSTMGGTPQ